jgi:S-adenosylmethionine-diacylglycerol 3-amino-3-carboxypropyl transferase
MGDTTTRPLTRTAVPGAKADKLFFAQVREDPLLELTALEGCLDGPLVIVSSGGCTALSLVAAGASDVVAVDLNRTQNHVVELKAVALAELGPAGALPFVGGLHATAEDRSVTYDRLRERLSLDARAYWDGRRRAVTRGILTAGKTDRFARTIFGAVRWLVHPRRRIDALFACASLEEQQELYREQWDNRRWRAMFQILFNRFVWNRVLDPAFFENTDTPSFAAFFHDQIEHSLTEVPTPTNYFLHHLLRGSYPVTVPDGVPPYLDECRAEALGAVAERLTLVDAPFLDYLRRRDDASVAGFSLSNICEWFGDDEFDQLLTEIVRTARPGARLCLRNFLGWSEIPERWRGQVHRLPLGDDLIGQDRSMVQRVFIVCDITKDAPPAG